MLTKAQTLHIIDLISDGKDVAVVFPNTASMRYWMFQAPDGVYETLKPSGHYGKANDTFAVSVLANQVDGTVKFDRLVGFAAGGKAIKVVGTAYGLASDNLERARGMEFDEIVQVDSEDFYRQIIIYHCVNGKLSIIPTTLQIARPSITCSAFIPGQVLTRRDVHAAFDAVTANSKTEQTPPVDPNRFTQLVVGGGGGPTQYEFRDNGVVLEQGYIDAFGGTSERFEAFKALRLKYGDTKLHPIAADAMRSAGLAFGKVS